METDLQSRIETLIESPADELAPEFVRQSFEEVISGLNSGTLRAASRGDDGTWVVHGWVKQAILLGFRLGRLEDYSSGTLYFFDKDTYPLKPLTLENRVRIVPGGSSIRTGAYVAPGVVCMPPRYINGGAYVDQGSLVDSHALVGSCAQVGKHVHVSAAVQIGGVLEPIGAMPVIVEDNVFLGGGCGIYEGCLVRQGAVLAPGVLLTGSTRIIDLVNETIIERPKDGVLEVPENAVVVPGSRSATGDFARENGVSLYAPVIVKYRDQKTDAATTLEDALREE